MKLRRSNERGFADHGWLKSFHSFSFADYYDPNYMGFRSLRVINEDYVSPGNGFGKHPHKDMEIITVVLKGELAHKDSMGNASVIKPGEVQRMSAGSGVFHSEFNHSDKEMVHLLQIWILPQQKGLNPSYEQKSFSTALKTNQLKLVASPNAADGSVTVHQDVRLFQSILEKEKEIIYKTSKPRGHWLQLIKGKLIIDQETLAAGDAGIIEDVDSITIKAIEESEFLLFDLA